MPFALHMSAFDPKRTFAATPSKGCANRYDAPSEPRGHKMRRRDFIDVIAELGSDLAARARAQQAEKLPRVGFLGLGRATAGQIEYYREFSSQLEKNGFREGQNIIVDDRSTTDPRGPFVSAAELLRAKPDLLVVAGPEVALQAVIGASGHIPIVMFAINFDPIERGYVTSLAHPGGNITGIIVRPLDLARKQVDLLRRCFLTATGWRCSTTHRLPTSSPRPTKAQSRSICRCRRSK